MAGISGIIYLVIGAGVTILSKLLERPDLSLGIFYWIGLLFIVIGTFKTIFQFISNKPKKEIDFNRPGLEPVKRDIPKHPSHPKYCPKCTLLYSQHSNFCSKCGSQLFIKP